MLWGVYLGCKTSSRAGGPLFYNSPVEEDFYEKVLGLMLVFGLVLSGCDTGGVIANTATDDTGIMEFPYRAVQGANTLSGKMYFEGNNKIAFSQIAEGAASGNYMVSLVKSGNSGTVTYAEKKTGTYSWDETEKTVTLKPEKVVFEKDDVSESLQTESEYKSRASDVRCLQKRNGRQGF